MATSVSRGSATEALLAARQEGCWSAYDNNSQMDGTGIWTTVVETDDTSTAGSDVDGMLFLQRTSAVIGNEAGAHSNLFFFMHERRFWPMAKARFKILSFADIRIFVGFSTNVAAMLSSDDAAAAGESYAGLLFSSTRPDTNWQLATGDGAVQDLVDTGVAPSVTEAYTGVIQLDDSPARAIITLQDRVRDNLFQDVLDTNIPATAAGMAFTSRIATRAAAVKVMHQYEGIGINRMKL